MITVAQARSIMLSMPDAEEKQHHGTPDFRIANRIFATLSQDRDIAVVKLSIADQTALMQMEPKSFSLNGWSHHGWTNVHLRHVTRSRFEALVRTSFEAVAKPATGKRRTRKKPDSSK